jgi:hypothetical protein
MTDGEQNHEKDRVIEDRGCSVPVSTPVTEAERKRAAAFLKKIQKKLQG